MVAKTQEKTAFLPAGATDYLKKRAVECAGIALIGTAFALLVALVSFNIADPSPNNANGQIPTNLLGHPGAAVADVALQSLGLASLLGFPILAGWGWRLVVDHTLPRAWIRLALIPIMAILTALALATLPRAGFWPLGSGMGGIIGDMILGTLSPLITGLDLKWLGIAAAIPAVAMALYAVGITLSEWRSVAVQSWSGTRRGVGMLRQADQIGPALKDLVIGRDDGRMEPILTPAAMRAAPARTVPAAPRPLREDRVEAPEQPKPSKRVVAERQIRLDLPPQDGEFHLPPLDILVDRQPDSEAKTKNAEGLEQNARMLEGVLEDFGVKGEIVKVRPGPVVTLYELEPAPGTKTSRVIGLSDDIARSMSAISVRIATVPGRSVIGIELPNARREMVGYRELVASETYDKSKAKLPLANARIDVSEIAGKPGAYQAVIFVRPHFQMEELKASIRMVAELPAPAA